jgi:hypothetical protein
MLFAGLLAMLVAVPAQARERESVRDQVELSMVLTGTIDVAPDGKVSGYGVDRAGDVPPGVLGLFAGVVPGWRFEPASVEGKPTAMHAYMSVRVVAKRQDGDNYRVSIRAVHFRQEIPRTRAAGDRNEIRPPRYPVAAARAGVAGTVYTVLRIGRDGRVLDAFAEQVDLHVAESEYPLARWRKLLADAALHAAKSWTLKAAAADTDEDSSIVRVPVDFALGSEDPYGRWQPYGPGPWQPPPWAGRQLAGGPEALPASGVFPVGRELHLLTPTGGD